MRKRYRKNREEALRPMPLVGVVLMILFFLASIAVGTVYAVGRISESREISRRRALAAPYELERLRVERELANFEAMLKDPMTGGATLTIALLGADVEIYENVWPIFREMNEMMNPAPETDGEGEDNPEGTPEDNPEDNPEAQTEEESETDEPAVPEKRMTATLCLSRDNMPGMENMMSLEQYAELRDNGWVTAVFIAQTDTDLLDEYLTDMSYRYEALGLEWTDTVYFERSVYSTAYDHTMQTNPYDPILKKHGITSVIDQVDEGEDILSNNPDVDIWCVKADGWSLSASKGSAVDNYNKLLEYKGAMVFAVQMWEASREGPTHFIPHFSDEAFKRMLVKFSESVVTDKLEITSASVAKESYTDYITEYKLRVEEYEPKRQELKIRLAELVDLLDKIYSGEYTG